MADQRPREHRYLVQRWDVHDWKTVRFVGDDPLGLTLEAAEERRRDPAWGVGATLRVVQVNTWRREVGIDPREHQLIWGGDQHGDSVLFGEHR